MGGSAGLRPGRGCCCDGEFHWRPQTLEYQHLCESEFALLGDMGFATSLLPRTKSLPVGGSIVVQLVISYKETASGHRPCHSLCLSFFPVSTLFPWNACTTGEGNTILLHLCFGRVCLPGGTEWGNWLERSCSKMGRAHVRNGGVLWM